MSAAEPHVYSVEWTAWERVFAVDGEECHREQVRVPQHTRQLVRSTLTADYEVVDALDVPGCADEPVSAHAGCADRSTAVPRSDPERWPERAISQD
jgi:hypothetical protein